MEKLIEELYKSELQCVFLSNANDFIKSLQVNSVDKFSYKDKIAIFGNGKRYSIKIYTLYYNTNQNDVLNNGELVECRYDCIRIIYYKWCEFNNIKPNRKEGWFSSEKFSKYLKSIDYFHKNYVIMVAD